MKESVKNVFKLIIVIALCILILTLCFTVVKNQKDPLNNISKALNNMLTSDDSYCVTQEVGGDIYSRILIKPNIDKGELMMQTESFITPNIEHPLTLVIDKDNTFINTTHLQACEVRRGIYSIVSKTYSDTAFIDIRDKLVYHAYIPEENDVENLDIFFDLVLSVLKGENAYKKSFDMLHRNNIIAFEKDEKDSVYAIYESCIRNLFSYFSNTEKLNEKLLFTEEKIPGGVKYSISVSREIAKEMRDVLKPLFDYIVVSDEYLLADEVTDALLSPVDFSITISDNQIKEVFIDLADYSYSVKFSVTECEEFEIDTSSFYDYIEIERLTENKQPIKGPAKLYEEKIIENSKVVYDDENISVNFLTLYKDRNMDDIFALISIDNKKQKGINLNLDGVDTGKDYICTPAGAIIEKTSERTYINFKVGDSTTNPNNVPITYNLSYNIDNETETINKEIIFSGTTSGEMYYE